MPSVCSQLTINVATITIARVIFFMIPPELAFCFSYLTPSIIVNSMYHILPLWKVDVCEL